MKPVTDQITQSVINTALNQIKDTLIMKRTYYDDATTSAMTGFNNAVKVVSMVSTELPYRENKNKVSCIPEGVYDCELHQSPSKGKCYSVKDVEGRNNILIHVGNYVYGEKVDSEGCILPAMKLIDINQDGHIDGQSSGEAMKLLFAKMPKKFKLIIYSDK